MTSQRPRRRRRIDLPAAALPRPASAPAAPPVEAAHPRRAAPARPLHHVTRDYSYVRRDLLTILVVGLVSFGFIGVMSFVVR